MFRIPDPRYYPPFLGERMQVGMVVRDLDEALRYWTEIMEVGPWILIEESLGDRHMVHRGEVTPVQMSLALTYIGETQFELIAQSNTAPSPYREFLEQGRQGVHHVAFYPDDYAEACKELERRGFDEVTSIVTATGEKSVSYFEGSPLIGAMVELVPLTDARRAYYGAMEALARSWDGSLPVRRFPTRADFLASGDVAGLTAAPQR